ncbi:type 1 glutamine amidotransferase [Rubellimicrobium arenae]|uniref:type 1 glutamine amidotransferase n=1 Tax=Rubellimicrobium arenae TaxID=2817372 RepID=UPI001B30C25A|nr:type 1 glutamine amidotransferase [Rubellimicrobium arenae]
MLIGILQTGHAPDALRPDYGDYPDLFERLLKDKGLTFRTWAVVDGEFPSGPHDAEGWLITGSRHGAYEDHPWIPPLERLIRDIYAEAVPLVGICFGHQIIAQALGGKVEKWPGGWSVGRTEYDWGGERVALNSWHQDQVVDKPEDAVAVASSPFCANAALVYGNRIFTVQAHPEFDQGFVADMIEKRGRGLVPDPLLDAAKAAVEQPIDDGRLADRIARFFKERVAA